MNWLDNLSDAGGELLNAVSGAGSAWLNGAVEQDLAKKEQSNPDEARKEQVQGQTANGQPIQSQLIQPTMNNFMVFGGLFLMFVLVVLLVIMKGSK